MSSLWIETFTGKMFPLTSPHHGDIVWADVAAGLALTNRYSGQTGLTVCGRRVPVGWSVAAHSIVCAGVAERMGYERQHVLGALLHDAHEAYIGDPTRPAKLAGLVGSGWEAARRRIDGLIAGASGAMPPDMMSAIDTFVLDSEAALLMQSRGEGWSLEFPIWVAQLHRAYALETIIGMLSAAATPAQLAEEFLAQVRKWWCGMEGLRP